MTVNAARFTGRLNYTRPPTKFEVIFVPSSIIMFHNESLLRCLIEIKHLFRKKRLLLFHRWLVRKATFWWFVNETYDSDVLGNRNGRGVGRIGGIEEVDETLGDEQLNETKDVKEAPTS